MVETPSVVTIGETMVMFRATRPGRLRSASEYSVGIGGAESNVAIALTRLGISAGWVGRVGEDEFGALVLSGLRGEGVDVSRAIIDPDHDTGLAFRAYGMSPITSHDIHYRRAASAGSQVRVGDLDLDYIRRAKHLHVTCLTAALSSEAYAAVSRACEVARESGVRVSVAANFRLKLEPEEVWAEIFKRVVTYANTVFATIGEATIVQGNSDVHSFIRLCKEKGVDKVVLTNGTAGSRIYTGREEVEIPMFGGEGPWPHGSGDAYTAGVIFGELDRRGVEESGLIGAILGACAASVPGNTEGLPTRTEVEALLAGRTARR